MRALSIRARLTMGIIILFLGLYLSAHSQTKNIVEINGRVSLPDGQPASQIVVNISSQTGPLASKTTDDQGSFHFEGMPKAQLTLTVTAPKDAKYFADPVSVDATRMGAIFSANLFLRNPLQAPVNQQRSAPLISSREMSLQIPKEAKKALSRAQKFKDQKKSEAALKELDKAIEIFPEYFQAYAEKGVVQIQSGHPRDALNDFESALKIFPDYEPALSGAGYCLLSSGRYEQSIAHLEKALHLDPTQAKNLLFLGISNLALSRWQKAQDALEQALKVNPNEAASAHMYLADAFAGQHLYRRAAEELHAYLQNYPEAPNAAHLRDKEKQWRSQVN